MLVEGPLRQRSPLQMHKREALLLMVCQAALKATWLTCCLYANVDHWVCRVGYAVPAEVHMRAVGQATWRQFGAGPRGD